LDSDDVGIYRKRACAAGAVFGTVITWSWRLSRCIYFIACQFNPAIYINFKRQNTLLIQGQICY
jgi:hypothetical protein